MATEETPSKLIPLCCPGCGAAIPVYDAESAACPHCRSTVQIPQAYRNALQLTRAQGAAVAQANAAWKRFQGRLSPFSFNVLYTIATLPALLVPLGLVAAAITSFIRPELSGFLPGWLTWAWVPNLILWPITGGMIHLGISRDFYHEALAILAPTPGGSDGKMPCCRQCGAPLGLPGADLFCHCIYCRTDNLILLSAIEARAIAGNYAKAEASAADALAAIEARARKSRNGMRFMSAATVITLIPFLLWSQFPWLWTGYITAFLVFPMGMMVGMLGGAGIQTLSGLFTARARGRPIDSANLKSDSDAEITFAGITIMTVPAAFMLVTVRAAGEWENYKYLCWLMAVGFEIIPVLGIFTLTTSRLRSRISPNSKTTG